MNHARPPWRLLDAGLARLSAHGYRDATWFYAGALPWCSGLLWAWTRFASWHATPAAYVEAALGLSLLYAWRSACSSRYAEGLSPASAPPSPLPPLECAGAGALFLLAWLASILALFWLTPTVYIAGVCFPLELRDALPRAPLRSAWAGAFRHSFAWYGEAMVFALHTLLLAAIALVNLVVAALLLPRLLASLLGIPSLWAEVPPLQLAANSGFWVGMVLLVYLLLAPVAQAAIVVAYEEQRDQRTGDDLRHQLERLSAKSSPVGALA